MSNNKKIIKISLIKNNEQNSHNEIKVNNNENKIIENENENDNDNSNEDSNENSNKNYIKNNINIHPNLNNYLLKDINYIKSTTIKEILKTLKLDGDTFKKLESHLNKEIKIN